MFRFAVAICLILALVGIALGFNGGSTSIARTRGAIRMEYIPDGLTAKQWADMKKREAEDKDKKGNQGILGTRKFKSRSFEAWQKAGGKHLFPVDPSKTPYEERPYMQRKDGDWEGNDLKQIGLQGKGQGTASQRLRIDDVYEKAKAEGKLDSASIFGGGSLPWTNEAVNEQIALNAKGQRGVAGKKLSPEELNRLKANLAKVSYKQQQKDAAAAASVKEAAPAKKGGFFGLF